MANIPDLTELGEGRRRRSLLKQVSLCMPVWLSKADAT